MNAIFLDQAQTGELINSIKRRAASVQKDIHQAAYSTLDHIRCYGDYTLALALLNALPNGQRVKALALWYKHFSGGKFSPRQDKKQGNIWVGSLAKDRQDSDFNIDEAVATSFADFSAEKDPQQVTVATLVKYLEKLAGSEATLPNGEPKVQPEAMALAQKLLSAAA